MKSTARTCLLVVLVVLGIGLIISCVSLVLGIGLFSGFDRSGLRIGWTEITGLNRKRCTYRYFSGREYQRFRADDGETVTLDYEADVERGSLTIRIEDPDDRQIWVESMDEDDEGAFEFTAEKSGIYTMIVVGNETRGSFEIEWDLEQ